MVGVLHVKRRREQIRKILKLKRDLNKKTEKSVQQKRCKISNIKSCMHFKQLRLSGDSLDDLKIEELEDSDDIVLSQPVDLNVVDFVLATLSYTGKKYLHVTEYK